MHSEVIIENLSGEVSETDVRELLEKHAKVNKLSLAPDQVSGDGTAVAFANIDCEKNQRQALLDLNGSDFHGLPLKIKALKQDTGGGSRAGGGGSIIPGGRSGGRARLGGPSGLTARKSSGGRGR